MSEEKRANRRKTETDIQGETALERSTMFMWSLIRERTELKKK